MARAWGSPVGSGCTMSWESAVIPAPASSPQIRAPRAWACSRRSTTNIAAPSPITKPSRSTSQGRDARSGSSLRRLIACIWAKQAMGIGWMQASVPPTTTTSARPSRIMSRPSEIASLLDAQAETGACTPARAPSRSPTLAADALAISIGTASGLTRRAPFSFWTSQLPSRVFRPPMPVATTTASRSRSTGLSSPSPKPALVQASMAAITASWAERSRRRASTRSSTSPGSTAAWRRDLARQVVGPGLLDPADAGPAGEQPSQVLGTSPPSGVVAPIPVTTTRVRDMSISS